MKALYFNIKEAPRAIKAFVGPATTIAAKLAPRMFAKLCFKVFMNPRGIRDYVFRKINPESFDIDSRQGKIRVYKVPGGEKHILLTHGWADTSKSLETLMIHLKNEDYTVWCFDHSGHGKSEGNVSNLFAFADGMSEVIKHIEEDHKLYALISHSMGGAGIINQDKEFLESKKIVFISSPVMIFEEMFVTFARIGISGEVLTQVLEYISDIYQKGWEELKPMKHKDKLHEQCFFIHDKEDKQCKYENILKLIEGVDVFLKITEGLGYCRVLKEELVLSSVSSFLKN